MTAKIHIKDEPYNLPHAEGREMAYERLIFNTTEDILLAMEDTGFSQADLARKLGKTSAHVSQLLNGTRNMTLKTLSDITYALGVATRVRIYHKGIDVSHPIVPATTSYSSDLERICDPEPLKITLHIKGFEKVIPNAF